MGKPTGFIEIERQGLSSLPPAERISNYQEFTLPPEDEVLAEQAARCMDCGIPFCHQGCPVNNIIPDWNDLVYRGEWRRALEVLHSTNNFPEFTGRICPAPCEESCTLNITDQPVTIKNVERSIAEHGWREGWITPEPAQDKTGKTVAVVGSGPAGLACAQQLARVGHEVTVFEKSGNPGGLLRYGIPDFKLEKHIVERRIDQMCKEGVTFRTDCHVGVDVAAAELMADFDAVVLAGGSEKPRDLEVPGRDLDGVHFAMPFLNQQNLRNEGKAIDQAQAISAEGKHVVVIGGGDTGSDCIGTSNRQGALSVTQLEILAKPPEMEDKALTWPDWPLKLRTSSSQEEGCERDWSIATKRFEGEDGHVTGIEIVRLEWETDEAGRMTMKEVEDSETRLKADLVLLAMGFLHPVAEGLLADLGVGLDGRGNVAADTDSYGTSLDKVFAAGDMRRGQSLVVWAIREGRQCARAVDEYLMGRSDLPR
ncbi:MAG: glutamate synthase subunit beta [Alphaproteobacteria bacterium]|nr:glutamate synthase subunit beta [Alphaproteobacteria bacterium]